MVFNESFENDIAVALKITKLWYQSLPHDTKSVKSHIVGRYICLVQSIPETVTVTKMASPFSVYHAQLHEPNFTLKAWCSPQLAYMSIIFILEMPCTV